MLSTARLLSDRLARSDDERTRALAPTILNTIDRAARLASDAHRICPRAAVAPAGRRRSGRSGRRGGRGAAGARRGSRSQLAAQLASTRSAAAVSRAADRDLLYRVFVNLGRNAFEAGATSVTVRARDATAASLLVEVADNGPGIPAAVAWQLFRPFTTGGRPGGTGLGLAIARDLVRSHGGDIVAASRSNARGHALPASRCRSRRRERKPVVLASSVSCSPPLKPGAGRQVLLRAIK